VAERSNPALLVLTTSILREIDQISHCTGGGRREEKKEPIRRPALTEVWGTADLLELSAEMRLEK
jgi:hypothetical protein